jgi:hexosaminidase
MNTSITADTSTEALFPDSIVHLGSDEVAYNCWAQDSTITPGVGCLEFPGPINETSYNQLEARFHARNHDTLRELGKKAMHWHDPVTERGLKFPQSSTLLEVWDGGDADALRSSLRLGYDTVYAGSYYLDHASLTWEDFMLEPVRWLKDSGGLSAEEAQRLVGLEACMWGETVDATNLLERTWPRAAALAERAWSAANSSVPVQGLQWGYVAGVGATMHEQSAPVAGGSHSHTAGILGRLHMHRCRLVARGVPASPAHAGEMVGDSWKGAGLKQGVCPGHAEKPE